MADLTIYPYDQVNCSVIGEESAERELAEYLSYTVPGAQFMQKRRRGWNGKIMLYKRSTKLVYAGLAFRIQQWCKRKGYTCENKVKTHGVWGEIETSQLLAKYPLPFPVRSYQRDAITIAMKHKRCVLISPTGSGKSAILYYLIRAHHSSQNDLFAKKQLLVVPTISLVSQMAKDWKEYGWVDVTDHVHQITGGVEKDTNKSIVVSTWQSIYKQPKDWFDQFSAVFIDETHLAKADSLRGILEKMPQCEVRVGVTGTLDDTKSHRLIIEGLLGTPYKVAKTSELQTLGHLTPIQVHTHILKYSDHTAWQIREHKRRYADEIEYFVQHPKRMEWLVDLVGKLQGNVLVMYQFVEKHGQPIFEALQKKYPGRPIHFISGDTEVEQRELIRSLTESSTNAIIVASYGTFSVGVNIKRLHFLVFASPSKSRYRVLQTIGRGLRLHPTKRVIYVMDVVDDASRLEYVNHLYKHWEVRERFYEEENFPCSLYAHQIE